MRYYYKYGNSTLLAKHELSAEEIGNWVVITEEEYNEIKARKRAEMRGETL